MDLARAMTNLARDSAAVALDELAKLFEEFGDETFSGNDVAAALRIFKGNWLARMTKGDDGR